MERCTVCCHCDPDQYAVTASADTARMSTDESRAALFDRIGGVDGVRNLIGRFYARVLADSELEPYFSHVELEKLRRMQFEFFCAALGAPIRYSGRSIVVAHHGRGITRPHFQVFVEHLFDTLREYSLDDEERYSIISRINTYVDEVIGSGVGLDT